MMKYITILMILLAALLVSGCSSSPITGSGQIQFREIFDQELSIEDTLRLNIDHDDDDEWFVLYRYDQTQNGWGYTPIQGIVYDAAHCEPPLIQNLLLPFPNNDYLGEGERSANGKITAYAVDWLKTSKSSEAPNELFIYGPGPVNTLSIYRLHDEELNPCKGPDPDKRKFNLQGFFRANGRIDWDEPTDTTPLTIRTYERTSYERSQLAIRNTYEPISDTNNNQTFINPGTERTRAPKEQSIDFLYGLPASPLDSPYPEKSVATFYLSLGKGNNAHELARSFLKDGPTTVEEFNDTPGEKWGLDVPPARVARVLIYSITYIPDREKERAYETRSVKVKIKVIDTDGHEYNTKDVTWSVFGEPITEGDLDCEWRLQNANVTPGLG